MCEFLHRAGSLSLLKKHGAETVKSVATKRPKLRFHAKLLNCRGPLTLRGKDVSKRQVHTRRVGFQPQRFGVFPFRFGKTATLHVPFGYTLGRRPRVAVGL